MDCGCLKATVHKGCTMHNFIKNLFKKHFIVKAMDFNQSGDVFILGKYDTVEEALNACSVFIHKDLENRRAYIDE
jgi:hypothetical protein